MALRQVIVNRREEYGQVTDDLFWAQYAGEDEGPAVFGFDMLDSSPIKAWHGHFDESKVRRHPKGTRRGGQFAPKFGESSPLLPRAQDESEMVVIGTAQGTEVRIEGKVDRRTPRQVAPSGGAWPQTRYVDGTYPFERGHSDGIDPDRLMDTLTPETPVERWFVGTDALVRKSDAESIAEPGTARFKPTFTHEAIVRRKQAVAKRLAERIGVSEDEAAAFVRVWATTTNDHDLRALTIQEAAADLFDMRLSDWQQQRIDEVMAQREAYLAAFRQAQNPKNDPAQAEFVERKAVEAMGRDRDGQLLLPFEVKYNALDTPTVRSPEAARDLTRKAVRAIYEMTQEDLKAAGVEWVVAYRGVMGLSDAEVNELKIGDWVSAPDNVLSSWSLHPDVAVEFAGWGYSPPEEMYIQNDDGEWEPDPDFDFSRHGLVVKARIPRELILASPRTGFGCLPEWELVVAASAGGWPGRVVIHEIYETGDTPVVQAWQDAGYTEREAIEMWVDQTAWPEWMYDDEDDEDDEDYEDDEAWGAGNARQAAPAPASAPPLSPLDRRLVDRLRDFISAEQAERDRRQERIDRGEISPLGVIIARQHIADHEQQIATAQRVIAQIEAGETVNSAILGNLKRRMKERGIGQDERAAENQGFVDDATLARFRISREWLDAIVGDGRGMNARWQVGEPNGDALTIALTLTDPQDGRKTGYLEMILYELGDAYWDYLYVDQRDERLEGYGGEIIDNMFRALLDAGYDQVTLEADLTIGRYAWARLGFDYDPDAGEPNRDEMFRDWAEKRMGLKPPPGGWPSFSTPQEYASYDIPGVVIRGSQIVNRDVPPDMEMHVGKAFMLDDHGHGNWQGILYLSDWFYRKAALRSVAALVGKGQARQTVVLWPKAEPRPHDATDYPFWAEWLARDRAHDDSTVKAWRAPFDESKHRRHPKGTRRGGQFAPKWGVRQAAPKAKTPPVDAATRALVDDPDWMPAAEAIERAWRDGDVRRTAQIFFLRMDRYLAQAKGRPINAIYPPPFVRYVVQTTQDMGLSRQFGPKAVVDALIADMRPGELPVRVLHDLGVRGRVLPKVYGFIDLAMRGADVAHDHAARGRALADAGVNLGVLYEETLGAFWRAVREHDWRTPVRQPGLRIDQCRDAHVIDFVDGYTRGDLNALPVRAARSMVENCFGRVSGFLNAAIEHGHTDWVVNLSPKMLRALTPTYQTFGEAMAAYLEHPAVQAWATDALYDRMLGDMTQAEAMSLATWLSQNQKMDLLPPTWRDRIFGGQKVASDPNLFSDVEELDTAGVQALLAQGKIAPGLDGETVGPDELVHGFWTWMGGYRVVVPVPAEYNALQRWYLADDAIHTRTQMEKKHGPLLFEHSGVVAHKKHVASSLAGLPGEPPVSDEEISDFIHNWAMTSNSTYLPSLITQQVAAEIFHDRFGTQLSAWQAQRLAEALQARAKRAGPKAKIETVVSKPALQLPFEIGQVDNPAAWGGISRKQPQRRAPDEALAITRAAITRMYEQTQAMFRAAGITHVVAYRGTGQRIPTPVEPGEHVAYRGNALESWSMHPGTAVSFAVHNSKADKEGDRLGVLVKSVIPVERILGTAKSGFGCLNEHELVVIGGDGSDVTQVVALYKDGWRFAADYAKDHGWIKAWGRFDETKHRRHPRGTRMGGRFAPKFGTRQAAPALRSLDEMDAALAAGSVDVSRYAAWAEAFHARDPRASTYDFTRKQDWPALLRASGITTLAQYLAARGPSRPAQFGNPLLEKLDLAALDAFEASWDDLVAFGRQTRLMVHQIVESKAFARAVQGRSLDDVFTLLAQTAVWHGEVGIGTALGERAFDRIVEGVGDFSDADAVWLAFDQRHHYRRHDENLELAHPRLRAALERWMGQAIHPDTGQVIAWGRAEAERVRRTLQPYEYASDTQAGQLKDAVVRRLSEATGLPYDPIDQMLHSWSRTANDTDMRSLGIQEAAAELFGLHLTDWQRDRLAAARRPDNVLDAYTAKQQGTDISGKQRYLFEPPDYDEASASEAKQKIADVLAAMYADTQAFFRQHGITHVRVYRGVSSHTPPAVRPGEVIQIEDNALASWSTDYSQGQRFSRDQTPGGGWVPYGYMVSAVVPVEDILATAHTGMGCLSEEEVVVMHRGPIHARVDYVRNLPRPELAQVIANAARAAGLPVPWRKRFPADTEEAAKAWHGRFDESKVRRHPRGTRQGGRFAPKWGARQAAPQTQADLDREFKRLMDKPDLTLDEVADAIHHARVQGDHKLNALIARVAAIEGWGPSFTKAVRRLEAMHLLTAYRRTAPPFPQLELVRLFPERATAQRFNHFMPLGWWNDVPTDLALTLVRNEIAEMPVPTLAATLRHPGGRIAGNLLTPAVMEAFHAETPFTYQQYLETLNYVFDPRAHLRSSLFGQLAAQAGYQRIEDLERDLDESMRNAPLYLPLELLEAVVPTLPSVSTKAVIRYAIGANVDVDDLEKMGAPMAEALDRLTFDEIERHGDWLSRNAWQVNNASLAVRVARNSGIANADDLERLLFEPSRMGQHFSVKPVVRLLGPQALQALFAEFRPSLDKMLQYGVVLAKARGFSLPGSLAKDLRGVPWAEVRAALQRTGIRLEDLGPDLIDALGMADLTGLTEEELWRFLDVNSDRFSPFLLGSPVGQAVANQTLDYNTGQLRPNDPAQAVVLELWKEHQGRALKKYDHDLAAQQKDAIAYRIGRALGISSAQASKVVEWWALNSNGGSSALLQSVADEIFDAGLSEWQKLKFGVMLAGMGKRLTSKRPVVRAMMEEMYRETQAWLARTGATHVRLYRGVNLPAEQAKMLRSGDTLVYTDNALSSWSLDPDIAHTFARRYDPTARGVVISAQVPVERILSTARTGFGCLDEKEFVVIGRDEPSYARVEFVQGGNGTRRVLAGYPVLDTLAAKAWRGRFDESKHRRHPKGTRQGGRFAPKWGAARQAAPVLSAMQGTAGPWRVERDEVSRRVLERTQIARKRVELWYVGGASLTNWPNQIDPASEWFAPTFRAREIVRRREDAAAMIARLSGLGAGDILTLFAQWEQTANDDDLRSIAVQRVAAEVMSERLGRPIALSAWQQERYDKVMAARRQQLANLMGQGLSAAEAAKRLDPRLRYPFELEVAYDPDQALRLGSGRMTGVVRSEAEALAMTRRAVEVIYDQTQKRLRQMGVDSVTAYRGVRMDSPPSERAGDEIGVADNVLASWTLHKDAAMAFARARPWGNYLGGVDPGRPYGLVLKARIPAELIFASPHEGFGQLTEWEFLAVGGTGGEATVAAVVDHGKLVPRRKAAQIAARQAAPEADGAEERTLTLDDKSKRRGQRRWAYYARRVRQLTDEALEQMVGETHSTLWYYTPKDEYHRIFRGEQRRRERERKEQAIAKARREAATMSDADLDAWAAQTGVWVSDARFQEWLRRRMPGVRSAVYGRHDWDERDSQLAPGILLERGDGAQLLVQMRNVGEYIDDFLLMGLWAKPAGSGMGTQFMRAMRELADLRPGRRFSVGKVANQRFFDRFSDWLQRDDPSGLSYRYVGTEKGEDLAAPRRAAPPQSALPPLRPARQWALREGEYADDELCNPDGPVNAYYAPPHLVDGLRPYTYGANFDQVPMLKAQNAAWLARAVGTTPERASAFIAHWAGGHSNRWLSTLTIQEEAAKLFGVPLTTYQRRQLAARKRERRAAGASGADLPVELRWPFGVGAADDPDEAQAREMTRRALQAMYDRTQAELAAAGIESVVAWRGVTLPQRQLAGASVMDTVTLRGNALSAWSLWPKTAAWYAQAPDDAEDSHYGAVFAARIPRARILSTPHTGFGSLGDAEIVVIGGRGDRAEVVRLSAPTRWR